MVKNKNKTVLLVLLLFIVILSLIASTYAFVRLSLSNQNNFRTSLKAGTMSLVFSDGNPGFNTQISLGGTVEKIFTIENTGQGETYATMSWRELQNTYTPGSLVYTLSESSDGGLTYTNRVSETPIPTSNTGLTIAENLTIPVGTTMYYKLTISYIFLEGVNQTQDLHAYLNTLFTLEEGSFIDKAVLKAGNLYKGNISARNKIKYVTFNNSFETYENVIESWDASTAEDGRIMAYLVNNTDSVEESPLYDLYIATDRIQIYGNNSLNSLFNGLSELEQINNLEMLNTSGVTSMYRMFSGCDSLTSLDVSVFNTQNVDSMGFMFSKCSSLTDLDLNNFDTSNVTSMAQMFSGCRNLSILDLSNFDTSNVTNMGGMFMECWSLINVNLYGWNTSQVTDMGGMFSSNYRYREMNLENLNLSSFNTSNVTDMSDMFYGCSSLTSLDLSNFDTSNVTYMEGMFYNCSNLNANITIRNNNVMITTSAVSMLENTCSNSGSLVINYTAEAESIVDEMLLQNTTGRVTKGVLVV